MPAEALVAVFLVAMGHAGYREAVGKWGRA